MPQQSLSVDWCTAKIEYFLIDLQKSYEQSYEQTKSDAACRLRFTAIDRMKDFSTLQMRPCRRSATPQQ